MQSRLARFWCLILIAALAGNSGCVTRPPDLSLNPATSYEPALARRAWIGAVRIADSTEPDRRRVEDALKAGLVSFARESRGFCEIGELPGPLRDDDLILDFRFDRFVQERRMHPAYLPGAILTLTLYTWLGGPIYQDRSALSGELRVGQARGQRLVTVRSTVDEAEDVSLWSPRYAAPVGIEARTTLMQDLLDRARERLHRLPGMRSVSAGCATTE